MQWPNISVGIKRAPIALLVVCLAAAALAFEFYPSAKASTACRPVTASLQDRVIHYTREQLGLPASTSVKVVEHDFLPNSCIARFTLSTAVDAGNPGGQRTSTLFLSEDHKYVFSRAGMLDQPRRQAQATAFRKTTPLTPAQANLLKQNAVSTTGNSGAPVTLVEFSDFQCPFCRKLALSLRDQISGPKHRSVNLVFHNYPLPMHSGAEKAAELGACIARQDQKAFWAFHDYAFDHQSLAATPEFENAALQYLQQNKQPIRIAEVRTCVQTHATASAIQRDIQLGNSYGVSGTPTLFINTRRVEGARSSADLAQMIADQHEQNTVVATARMPEPAPKPSSEEAK